MGKRDFNNWLHPRARVGAFGGTFAVAFFIVSASSPGAHAYMASQEQQWQADLKEAKVRAKDFNGFLSRREAAVKERNVEASETKRDRERALANQERDRQVFVLERDHRPTNESIQLRLEHEHDLEAAEENRRLELQRREYVTRRNKFRESMMREAFIDEAVEYEVHSALSVEEQKKNQTGPLLKLEVIESKNK